MARARLAATILTLALGLGAPAPAVAQSARALAPLPASEWDLAAARHLLARAGFGGTLAEVEALHALGPEGAVDHLVNYESLPALPPFTADLPERVDYGAMTAATREERQAARARYLVAHRRALEELRRWWVEAMCRTQRPLEEKMTLFWHGHFTSSFRDVRNTELLLRQHELLRRHATGDFGDLVHAIARDPAMLEYLDNNRNRRASPNENFARELLELFMLGEGHYGENDIKEAARAFTGWTFGLDGAFRFAQAQHDYGEKTFLGQTGRFDGAGVIDVVLRRERCSVWICERLWRFFVSEEIDERAVAELARILRGDEQDPYLWRYELKPVLTAMFRSRAFYADDVVGGRIKSPIELVVGAVRELELPARRTSGLAVTMAAQMGQSLFDPPNVKGWPGGREWISTSALYDRYNFAGLITRDLDADTFRLRPAPRDEDADDEAAMASGAVGGRVDGDALIPADETMAGDAMSGDAMSGDAMSGDAESEDEDAGVMAEGTRPEAADLAARLARRRANPAERLVRLRFPFRADELARRNGFATAEEVVDGFSRICLAVELPETSRQELVAYLNGEAFERPGAFDAGAWDASRRLKGMLHLLLATPEYQLN